MKICIATKLRYQFQISERNLFEKKEASRQDKYTATISTYAKE